jgi:hypothetical protein
MRVFARKVFRLGDVGTPLAPGSEGPDAVKIRDPQIMSTGLRSGADKGLLMPSISWPVSFSVSLVPSPLTAAVAHGVRRFAMVLDARLRDRALKSMDAFWSLMATESQVAIDSFGSSGDDPDVRLALEEIAPERLSAARGNLAACDERGYQALIDFLEVTGEGLQYDIRNSEAAADVGDALLRALDSFHHFLLAHDLVGPGYGIALADRRVWIFKVTDRTLDRNVHWRSPAATGVPRHFTRDEPDTPVCLA